MTNPQDVGLLPWCDRCERYTNETTQCSGCSKNLCDECLDQIQAMALMRERVEEREARAKEKETMA